MKITYQNNFLFIWKSDQNKKGMCPIASFPMDTSINKIPNDVLKKISSKELVFLKNEILKNILFNKINFYQNNSKLENFLDKNIFDIDQLENPYETNTRFLGELKNNYNPQEWVKISFIAGKQGKIEFLKPKEKNITLFARFDKKDKGYFFNENLNEEGFLILEKNNIYDKDAVAVVFEIKNLGFFWEQDYTSLLNSLGMDPAYPKYVRIGYIYKNDPLRINLLARLENEEKIKCAINKDEVTIL